MTNEKDLQLLERLVGATEQGRITWEPTARLNEFTSSFKGRFSIIVGKVAEDSYLFRMTDEGDRDMLTVEYIETHRIIEQYTPEGRLAVVRKLYDSVQRQALHVDKAIEDILQELNRR